MRRDVRLEIITEAIERLIPGATPAFLTVEVTETLPATGEQTNTWSGRPDGLAEHIFTRLYGRPGTPEQLSPLAQAEDAKRRRDLVGELGALTSAGRELESAPWYPLRSGDLVLVHYEATPTLPAYGETYVIGDVGGGLKSMQLISHTYDGELDGMVGHCAVEAADCPIYEAWFEAGPHRLTIVRDGQVVHDGGRRRGGTGAARVLLAAEGHAATMREVQRFLERGEPELALARLTSGKPLPPCGAPGFTAEQPDCPRPQGHRGACSNDADYVEPPHECPALPEQLHAVLSVGPKRTTISFEGLYADREGALDAASGWDRRVDAEVRVSDGMPHYTFIDLPAPGGPSVAVVAPMPVMPGPRDEDEWGAEGMSTAFVVGDYSDDYDGGDE